MAGNKPLTLIIARNLLSVLTTPGFLVESDGTLTYYNDAAGAMLERGFEETGPLTPEQWTRQYGPFEADGRPMPFHRQPLQVTLRDGRPSHGKFRIRSARGSYRSVEASAVPVVGADGSSGAIVICWPASAEKRVEVK